MRGAQSVLNAFGPLKAKLTAGENAVVWINADSTGYSEFGPFFKLARSLGDLHDFTVILYRWAEWVTSAPTGPKEYSAPVTLRTGTRGTLVIYLASLPGAVAGQMFDASRKAAAIDAVPTPDLCVTHHGHNMQSFETNSATGMHRYSAGASNLLGPIGMTEIKWPGVPQLITTQNPWRDNDDYAKVYQAARLVAISQPEISIVDSYVKFIDLNKAANLFRDNVHPSDTEANSAGAQLVADALIDAYRRAKSGPYTTAAWPLLSGPNLLDNGDFSNWTAAAPSGWSTQGAGTTVAKDTDIKYGPAAYSLSLTPSGTVAGQNSNLLKYLSATEMARIAGKTVNLSILYRRRSTQIAPYLYFSIKDNSGNIRDYITGALINCSDEWMWACIPGIQVINAPADGWRYLRIFTAFGTGIPANLDPINIQRVMLTEGVPPRGLAA
ncbi:SGNH/GDSL hydrolase family protein [Agrobacterium salinitolerans]|uniref:SGNH/GDSL hydrolase family protein n=2 Tax=Rhizobium/Agrobacterium group TaxID=227290 RepID=A0ABY3BWC9_9HYPH|nr:SGNH/GDSL hydrolase family protein [Agrobacterium salinitolerans]